MDKRIDLGAAQFQSECGCYQVRGLQNNKYRQDFGHIPRGIPSFLSVNRDECFRQLLGTSVTTLSQRHQLHKVPKVSDCGLANVNLRCRMQSDCEQRNNKSWYRWPLNTP